MGDVKKFKGKKFERPPIVQVVCEIRFPINLTIDCQKDKFFEKVRKEFPDVKLPDPIPVEHHLVQPIAFVSSDERKKLTASVGRFSFITKDYADYHSFRAEAVPILHDFINTYGITILNRFGLRYINHVPVERNENGVIDYTQVLQMKYELPKAIHTEGMKDFQSVFVCKAPNGSIIRTLIGNAQVADRSVIILDNDVAFQAEIKTKELEKFFDSAHEEIENIYLEIMRDSYLESTGVLP